MQKNIELYVNESKKKALSISKKVKESLLKSGYTIVNGTNIAPDIVIGFGGDGTLLKWLNENNYNTKSKYIGINCGTLGFLQDINLDDILNFSQTQKDFIEEKLHFIEINITQNTNTYVYYALNEFDISAQKTLRVKVDVNGEWLEMFNGTGMLFCSPTGSTAWNLSSGGCILSPRFEGFQMTPREPILNSKMRCLNRSFCFPKDELVTIYPNDLHKIIVKADNFKVFNGNYSNITVSYSDKFVIKLTDSKYKFITKVREKLIE